MIFDVLGSREAMHLEVMTHIESVHLYAEFKNGYTSRAHGYERPWEFLQNS
jgi:hypothetical protein